MPQSITFERWKVEGKMKNKKKRYGTVILLCLGMCMFLFGCKKKQQPEATATAIATEVAVQVTTEPAVTATATKVPNLHKGETRSKLTGQWVKKSVAKHRPYAVMINNIQAANPQSGIGQASILYEAIAEGDITRMMGIFEDFDGKRIGSVRSARHYFVSFADVYDGIFVHYGQTKYALSKIAELGVDNLSGLESVGSSVFYRDSSVRAPHNAFTSYDGIIRGTNIKKYRTTYRKGMKHFTFYKKQKNLKKGKNAAKITLGYSNHPYFEYHKKDKQYYRFQFGKPHIDATTNKQLKFKNIIVQYVREWNIDKNGYQTMDIENASGTGYYATNGRFIPITWKKNEAKKTMKYYNSKGKELVLNPGKTYIAVYPENREEKVIFSGK